MHPKSLLVPVVTSLCLAALTTHADDKTASSPFFEHSISIPGTVQMHWFDKGGEGVAYHEADNRNANGEVRKGAGVDIARSGGDFYLGWMTGDEWVRYSLNVADHATYRIEARVASEQSGGKFRLEFFNSRVKVSTRSIKAENTVEIDVPNTGGWNNWQYVYAKVILPSGPTSMRVVHLSEKTAYNIERIRFRHFDPRDLNRDGKTTDDEASFDLKKFEETLKTQTAVLNEMMLSPRADQRAFHALLSGWRPTDGSHLPDDAPWKLVWADEFDRDGKPDPQKWKYETGYLLRNREAQHYTDHKKNAYVKDGHLIIEAIKEKSKAPNGKTADYSSASLYSAKPFRYGRIDVRAKLPTGRGMWPAIWMLADRIGKVRWPLCGEIDIMENVGYDPHVIHGSVHTLKYNHTINTHQSSAWELDKPWETFHVYGIEWHPERIDFYIDRVKYMTFANEGSGEEAWPFDNPHNLKLNIAVGGMWGGVKGIDDSIFPQRMEIDYVRVYEAAKKSEE